MYRTRAKVGPVSLGLLAFHRTVEVSHGLLHGPLRCSVHFNPVKAERDLRRYQRRGPDATTRLILEELRRWPFRACIFSTSAVALV